MEKSLVAEILHDSQFAPEISRLCAEHPGYKQASERMDQWYETLKQALGEARFLEFEDAMAQYFGLEAQMCYLFGLRLRRELWDALMEE